MENSKQIDPEQKNISENEAEDKTTSKDKSTNGDMEQKLNEAYVQNESVQNKYLRAMAELENLRKRSIREREEAVVRTRIELFSDILPFLDSLNLGLDEAKKFENGNEFTLGFSMALDQFEGTLEKYGFETIDPVGEEFDSKIHEAIGYEDSTEQEDGKILKTVRVGYRLRETLLRPASVVLAKEKTSDS